MKYFALLGCAILMASMTFAQDSVEETLSLEVGPFDLTWHKGGNLAGRGSLYFQNSKYDAIVDLGSIWFNREELDVLHTKIVECLDYTMNKEKTATAKWNLPDGAYIESNKEYDWNWLSADGKYHVIRKGMKTRDAIDQGFTSFKEMIDN